MLEKFLNIQPEFCEYAYNLVKNKKISHAYFIESGNFKDSKELVISFAKYILFNNINFKGNKDDIEKISLLIDSNNYSDLYIIDPEESVIKKNQIADLKDEFKKKSATENLRIYIINEADKLNKHAANSLLKFLEEPEENIIGIFVSNSRYNVLKTIISRCQIFKLKDIDNNYNSSNIKDMLDFILNIEKNGLDTICYMKKLWHNRYLDKDQVYNNFDLMIYIYRDIINYKLGQVVKLEEIVNDYKDVCNDNDLEKLLYKIDLINRLKNNLQYNLNNELMMDKFVIDMVGDNCD